MPPTRHGTERARGFVVMRDGEAVPSVLSGAIVAIGNFDGVHLGHRRLVAATRGAACRLGRPSAVLTFEPHPRSFFAPEKPVFRLTPEPVKITILDRLGIDAVFVRRFDAGLAGTSATDFVERLLGDELGVSGVVVGHDFHFGKGRAGTPALLEELCARKGWACIVVPPVTLGGEVVSSGVVRAALGKGDVAGANAFLGHRWFVQGEVSHGEKRGRTLGFPTANLRLADDCELRHGIYAVRAAIAPGEVHGGVVSFGRRPTFDNGAPLLEVFLFDFAGDLYGREIEVEFVGWIRGEERFPSADALVGRMKEDAAEARRLLAADDGSSSMIG